MIRRLSDRFTRHPEATMTSQLEHDYEGLDHPIAYPRPNQGYGIGAPPFRDEALGAWVVSAYEDVDRILRDPETFSSKNILGPGRDEMLADLAGRIEEDSRAERARTYARMSFLNDGDVHKHQRSFVNKAFTPKRVKQYEPTIRALCDELADGVIGRTNVELVEEFSVPLTVRVIAGTLGMPPKDFRYFKRWSDGFEGLTTLEPTAEELDAYLQATIEFTDYIGPLIDQRREEPAEDIISEIAGANAAGDFLERNEVLAMTASLMVAGSETTTATLNGTMMYLVRKPDVQDQVRSDLSLIPALVEEGLRLTAPAQALFRTATADAEVGGAKVTEGEHVYIRFAAANRDEARYEEALCPRLDRPDKRHLAFGRGPHTCPGAPLARAELAIAIETLLTRTSSIALSDVEEPIVATGSAMTARAKELHLDLVA
jgi:cytochrome P450